MADPLLRLTVSAYSATEFRISVTNIGALLDQSLKIELFPPTSLVDQRIKQAAQDGLRNPIKSSLDGIVTGPTGWSFWAKPHSTTATLAIELYNYVDQATREEKTPVPVPVGAVFVVSIPLKPVADRQDIQLEYKYTYNTTEQFIGKLELKSDTSGWQPDVTLSAMHPSPTAITPGTSAKIKWVIRDGVSATLYGPLTEGNSFLILSSNPDATYKIAEGSIEVRVVSTLNYLLTALVKGPAGQIVQVARMLTLDTLNSDKYLYVNTRPITVLPYGRAWIDWAAWGVTPVQIRVGSRETHNINLPGRIPEGNGFLRVNASGGVAGNSETVLMSAPSHGLKKSADITTTSWLSVTSQGLSGQPLGLAVVAPKLAVLTTEGLFIADVGTRDSGSTTNLQFTRSTTTAPKQWLALTALDTRFVALRRTSQDELEVAPYKKEDGSADTIPPVTLPAYLRLQVAARETVFDVVGFRGRAYIVLETVLPSGILRRAFSVGFSASSAEYRSEPLLESLTGYKLVVFNNALYALSRKTGRLLRFNLSTSGTLELPLQAASAVTKSQGPEQSMVKEGLIVPVGNVLAVLDPNAVPSLEEMEPYELRNVIMSAKTMLQAVDPHGNPQDIFYNPQKDYWGRCGHGLDVKPGALTAFRSGDSPRLWLIQPDGKMHTLAVGGESLFAHDFMPGAVPWPLQAYFKKRQFTITNTCPMQLQPMTSVPAAPIDRGARAQFELHYNEGDAPVQLRFLLENVKGVKHQYLLEMSFSGPNLSRLRWVFQRLEIDEQGTLSMAEIPGSAVEQTSDVIVPYSPPRLVEGFLLSMANYTNYQLFQQAPEASDPAPKPYNGDKIRIGYNTPTFFVYGQGAGELHVNVDLSLPAGIELSPASAKQNKAIRINTDRSLALYPELLPNPTETSFQLNIDYRRKVLEGVYVGDGVATKDGTAIFLPLALPNDQSQVRVLKINCNDLSQVASDNLRSPGGLFAPPNSIALSNEYVFMMIDNDIYVMNHSFQRKGQANVNNFFTFVSDMDAHFDGPDCFLVGMKQDRPIDTSKPIWFHYLFGQAVMAKDPSSNLVLYTVRDTSLDAVRGIAPKNPIRGAPTWVSSATFSPMAISPIPLQILNMRKVAVCIEGGLFVVEPNPIKVIPVPSAGREEDIVFGRDGRTVYCLHTRTDNQGLLLSRVNIENSQVQSLLLPRGEGPYDLVAGQQVVPQFPNKNQRAASVVVNPEETWLFVSHGKSIFKIQNGPTMAYRETYSTELPCRVLHVGKNPAYGNVLYAIGASYRGDGKRGSGVTHLYKIRTFEK